MLTILSSRDSYSVTGDCRRKKHWEVQLYVQSQSVLAPNLVMSGRPISKFKIDTSTQNIGKSSSGNVYCGQGNAGHDNRLRNWYRIVRALPAEGRSSGESIRRQFILNYRFTDASEGNARRRYQRHGTTAYQARETARFRDAAALGRGVSEGAESER
jgi:hypothetical protein